MPPAGLTDERRETRLALSASVGLWGLLFGPFLASSGLPVYRDLLLTYLPLRHFWAERVASGRLPAWFPWEGLGRQFIGQGVNGTFHPVNWLWLVLDDALALRVEIAGSVLIAIVGQTVLARHFKLSAVAAVTGAMVLALSGYTLSMTSNTPYLRGLCMLPWVALFASQVLTLARPWGAIAALSVVWALIPLGGDAATTLLAALVVAAVTLAHAPGRRAGWLFLSAGLAGLLAAPELLPASALHRDSIVADFRNANFLASFWALHPERLPELLLPRTTLEHVPSVLSQSLHEPGRWAESVLLGAPAVALALSVPRQRVAIAFFALFALGLWLALGVHGGLDPLLRHLVPPLNAVRYPEKHLALATFGLAGAAAFGAERVVKTPLALLPGGLLVLVGLLVSWFVSREGALLVAVASFAGLGVVWLSQRAPRAAWLLPLVVVFSLWKVPLGMMTVDLRAPLALPGTGRVWVERTDSHVPVDHESLQAWAQDALDTLAGDLGALHHRASFGLSANLPLAPKRERLLLGWNLTDTRRLATVFGFDLALLSDGTQLPMAASPRAWVAHPSTASNGAELVRRLREAPELAVTHPLIAGPPAEPSAEGVPGEVSFVRDELDTLELEARMTAPGLLVLNELAAPGWSVSVDGQPADLVVVNALVRGVWLSEGTHRALFAFEVPRLRAGLALGGVGLSGVLAFLLAWAWSRRG